MIDLTSKLLEVERRYESLTEDLGRPEVLASPDRIRTVASNRSEIEPLVLLFRDFQKVQRELAENRALAETPDPEMAELARLEIPELEARAATLEADLAIRLLPKDPNDEKNIIVEIRAGTGGEEAALFAGDLFRMYSRYAEQKRWKIDVLDTSAAEAGGLKEIVFEVSGQRVYSVLKYESGVHRVQRVPATEASGRIHTSTATVVVLPEAEEVDIQINEKDLRIDTFCASGHGGQSVNTTYSAIRITHLPTNTVVQCQDERSQMKNKAKAMTVLRTRLLEVEEAKRSDAATRERKQMVGTGDRSEKIRTYNFHENRVTDHRIKVSFYKLQEILAGNLSEVIDSLVAYDREMRLKSLA